MTPDAPPPAQPRPSSGETPPSPEEDEGVRPPWFSLLILVLFPFLVVLLLVLGEGILRGP